MAKYWAFAQGGAWRNPKPTGGPYICEQCCLDATDKNDGILIALQAVTVIELVPTDVCADCGERLVEELEIKDRACPPADLGWHYSRMEEAVILSNNKPDRQRAIAAGNVDVVVQ